MEIKRSIFNKLVDELSEPLITILIGARQVGKTTLLRWLLEVAKKRGGRCRFFDLEQPDDLNYFSQSTAVVMQQLFENYDFVFIDEFYYLRDAGKLLKAIYDRSRNQEKKIKLIVSGSSAAAIHSHLKQSMAGRTLTHVITPISYVEYSDWKSALQPDFTTYLCYGGLPGLSQIKDEARKQELLQEYLSRYLYRDIKGLIREENTRAFNQMLYFLAQNQGSLIEISALAREVGLNTTTANRYLEVMQQTFVNFSLHSYHTNQANELKKSRKTYFYDLGIRNCILKDFRPPNERPDIGVIFESAVFLTLKPLLQPNMELFFWRTKKQQEVDFVLVKNRLPYPIEVKSNQLKPTASRGLHVFCRRHPKIKQMFTICQTAAPTQTVNGVTHHILSHSQAHLIAQIIK